MDVTLYGIEHIEGYDVTFLKLKFETGDPWITAYVRFDEPTNRDGEYPPETYNEKDVYGVDTAHIHNEHMTLDQKVEDARRQIREIILIHDGKMHEE